jgi:hypothetical protein
MVDLILGNLEPGQRIELLVRGLVRLQSSYSSSYWQDHDFVLGSTSYQPFIHNDVAVVIP